ncbi:MAG: 2-C-methyl-D-erythritol 2,4-cyclodiphosphate synthase [Candidatus Peregrinibacteria bacterium]
MPNPIKYAKIIHMNHAVILAAGQGQRMNSRKDKMFLPVRGKPLIYFSLMAFNDHPLIETITLIGNKLNKKKLEEIVKIYRFPKVKKVLIGGNTRQNSVEIATAHLEKVASPKDTILIHNGANPLPSQEEITQSIKEINNSPATIVGHFVSSTIKEIDDKHVIQTHDRKKLFEAQTPQTTTLKLLARAVKNAQKKNLEATDEAMLLEAIDQKITFLPAHENNFKITTQKDYTLLRTILGDFHEDFRVGIGQDSHLFDDKKTGLTLAGVFLKDEPKLEANSDGDVIYHALFNALSQAIGDMSLGFYADDACQKGQKDSAKYLDKVLKRIKKEGFSPNSLGLMIEAKTPKIDPLVKPMRKNLSTLLNLHPRSIGITATSGENATIFGAGLGIQCFAIVSLVKK